MAPTIKNVPRPPAARGPDPKQAAVRNSPAARVTVSRDEMSNGLGSALRREMTARLGSNLSSSSVSNISADLKVMHEILDPGGETIAVFDHFGPGLTHGDYVENVVTGHDDKPTPGIREIETGAPETPRAGLDDWIKSRVVGLLDSTSDGLETILNDPASKIQVINQSQSTSEIRIVSDIWDSVKNDPVAKAKLAAELGLKPGAQDKEILQALVNRVEHVFDTSPEIAASKARYDRLSQQLEARGILHVVTAGNNGDELAALDAMGITHDDDFTRSALFNDQVLVVGASTGNGDEMDPDSTPSDQVDLVIDGTKIDVGGGHTGSGTSFSAPQVTAVIAQMRRINPDLTNDQIRAMLKQACRDTAAPDQVEGAGILDPQKALLLAELSLLKSQASHGMILKER